MNKMREGILLFFGIAITLFGIFYTNYYHTGIIHSAIGLTGITPDGDNHLGQLIAPYKLMTVAISSLAMLPYAFLSDRKVKSL